jgi:hypothetical protein
VQTKAPPLKNPPFAFNSPLGCVVMKPGNTLAVGGGMPQNLQAMPGVAAAALSVAISICAWYPCAASAQNSTLAEPHPVAHEGVSPFELYRIQNRCYQLLYKMKFAGDPFYSPDYHLPTEDIWERMIHTPAFRACVERGIEAKKLGY